MHHVYHCQLTSVVVSWCNLPPSGKMQLIHFIPNKRSSTANCVAIQTVLTDIFKKYEWIQLNSVFLFVDRNWWGVQDYRGLWLVESWGLVVWASNRNGKQKALWAWSVLWSKRLVHGFSHHLFTVPPAAVAASPSRNPLSHPTAHPWPPERCSCISAHWG